MKVKKNQIFNLVDTNGRCNSLIEANTVFLETLYNICDLNKRTWNTIKNGYTTQYDYYEQVKEKLKDIFEKNEWYYILCNKIREDKDVAKVIKNCNKNNYDKLDTEKLSKTNENGTETKTIASIIDTYIEARARHYTNNLVKIGFTDKKRTITEVGYSFLEPSKIERDEIEKLLPISNANIVYLRQLMKLRIFDSEGKKYYSPFQAALYLLLKKPRISQNEFCEIVQGLSPYYDVSDYDEFIDKYQKDDIIKKYNYEVPEDIDNCDTISWEIFSKHFTNQKSRTAIIVYYEFYNALNDFVNNKNDDTLNRLLTVYEKDDKNKQMLNKAFGYSSNIFKNKRGSRPTVEEFLEQEKTDLFEGKLNSSLYIRFMRSKTIDIIREYSDTTIRIFKATGLISFDDGYVELVCRDLCLCIFDCETVKSRISGDITSESIDNISDYENIVNSYYCSNYSTVSILGYSEEHIRKMKVNIEEKFGGIPIDKVPAVIKQNRKKTFDQFVKKHYPEDRVKSLLAMFSDRSNDGKLKKEVCAEATISTIYEYIVGLAWYYFSNKKIDLLSSYNLTLSADFEPLTHAGGGMGDIVIYENDKVIMLEATLMNANSQKRGEWEPVLRHSVNLKIEEENSMNREVTTFFIADSFDYNTINIWKAVSSVSLQSSKEKEKFTDKVIIMPINNYELSKLMESKKKYNSIIKKVRKLFLKDIRRFDKEWRDKFIGDVIPS